MVKQIYTVLEEFDGKKDYGIEIRRQYQKCLSTLKKGEKITPAEYAKQHLNEFTLKPRDFVLNRTIVSHSCTIGKRIGMLQEVSLEDRGIYDELLKKFDEEGHSIHVVSPNERRERKKTELIINNGLQLLKVKTFNIQKLGNNV